jgi:hypothetical protein
MTQERSVFVVVVVSDTIVSVEVNDSLVDVADVLVIVSEVCEVKVLVEVVIDVSVFEVVLVALVVAVLERVVVAVLVIVVSTSIPAVQLSLKAAYCTLPKEIANDSVVRSMIECTRSKFGFGRYSSVLNLAAASTSSPAAATCLLPPNIAEGACRTPRSNASTSRSASSVRS